jgi:hypothetical protein
VLSSIFWSTPAKASNIAACDTYQVNGGDEAFLMTLNTKLEFGGQIYDGNIYVSPKGTVTFGQGDYTFWDYPATPSISIGSYDYHAFAGGDNDLYVRYGSTETSICVDWKVLPWGQFSGEPIYIRMIAQVNPVNYTWTPTYQVSSNAPANARYGLRYVQGGPIVPLTIQTITTPPVQDPVVLPPVIPPQTPEGASVIQEGSVFEFTAPEGKKVASVNGYYGDPADGTKGLDVSSTLSELFSGKTSGTVQVSNDSFGSDPVPGTNKVLIILITYEDIPIDTTPIDPGPTTPPSNEESNPGPTQEPAVPVEPVVPPTTPIQPENPAIIEPEVPQEPQRPTEEPTVEPTPEPTREPTPQPTIPPAEEPTPTPTETEEPIEEPTENEPGTIPEPESPSTTEILGELTSIAPEDLTANQIEELLNITLEIFETAEPGSEEYEQALDALMLIAEADDLELPSELAAIPLLGDVAGAILDVFNDLGNVGADMSPQVRETAEKIVVVSVIVTQVVAVTAIGAMASTSIRRP